MADLDFKLVAFVHWSYLSVLNNYLIYINSFFPIILHFYFSLKNIELKNNFLYKKTSRNSLQNRCIQIKNNCIVKKILQRQMLKNKKITLYKSTESEKVK